MNQKLLLAFAIVFFSNFLSIAQERTVLTLTDNWKFQRGKNDTAFEENFNDSKWEKVTVPHDWAIKGPFDKNVDVQMVTIAQDGLYTPAPLTGRSGALPYVGEAWYRNTFSTSDFDESKKAILLFEGAMSETKVYINGKKSGRMELWLQLLLFRYFKIFKFEY